jgi:WD40 repeat protein
MILSAGRDNAVRLWDTRMMIDPSYKPSKPFEISTPLREFNKHKCAGYNIAANFLNYENYLITGSEDNHVRNFIF